MNAWNPEQYERFKAQRSQPFHDLLSMVSRRPGLRVLDLGSGTGELTRHLHDSLQATETIGLDSSREMLKKSAAFATSDLHFLQRDLRETDDLGSFDLVFSNAALHWVGNHEQLLIDLRSLLRDEGQLAVQVPANHDHISQTHAAELATHEPFSTWLAGFVRESPVLPPQEYERILTGLKYRDLQVSERVYLHELPSREAVVEWVQGTTLTAYQELLSAGQYGEFLATYRSTLLPQLSPGSPYQFTFKRTFFTARA